MVPKIEFFPWVSHGFDLAVQEGNEIDWLVCNRRVSTILWLGTGSWKLYESNFRFSCSMFRLDGKMPSKQAGKEISHKKSLPGQQHYLGEALWMAVHSWVMHSLTKCSERIGWLLWIFFFFLPCHKCSVSSCSRECMPAFLHLSIFTIGSPE